MIPREIDDQKYFSFYLLNASKAYDSLHTSDRTKQNLSTDILWVVHFRSFDMFQNHVRLSYNDNKKIKEFY